MCRTLRSLAACATLYALVLSIALPSSLAGVRGEARLEGLVLGLDGRAAAGHRVHLIDSGGAAVARSEIGADGLYSFAGLGAGRYSLGIEMPDGSIAPVAAPPIRLHTNELARRDMKLLASEPATTNAALQANYGLGSWWNGLSTGGKAWTVIGIVLAGVLIYSVLDDDESSASPS